jgi:hypothetical protein
MFLNTQDNRDIGVLVLGDATPCECVFVNCNITGNVEGAVTIHGCVPDMSSCYIDGTISLINTPPARPSPSLPARKFAGPQCHTIFGRGRFSRVLYVLSLVL